MLGDRSKKGLGKLWLPIQWERQVEGCPQRPTWGQL